MNASSKNRLPGALGALIGLAIVAVFAIDLAPPGSAAQGFPHAALLGRAVGEFIGLGFSVALLAFGLARLAARNVERRRVWLREASIAVALAPRIYDATASELGDDAKLPGFAPVVSLTETQVERRRADRQRRERRSALRGA